MRLLLPSVSGSTPTVIVQGPQPRLSLPGALGSTQRFAMGTHPADLPSAQSMRSGPLTHPTLIIRGSWSPGPAPLSPSDAAAVLAAVVRLLLLEHAHADAHRLCAVLERHAETDMEANYTRGVFIATLNRPELMFTHYICLFIGAARATASSSRATSLYACSDKREQTETAALLSSVSFVAQFLGDLRSLVRFVSFWKKRAKLECVRGKNH